LHVTDDTNEPRVTFCDSFLFTPAFFIGTVTVPMAPGKLYTTFCDFATSFF